MNDAPDPGTVQDHPAEMLFREAAAEGAIALACLSRWLFYDGLEWALAVKYAGETVDHVAQAASLYHEAQREAGECPMCGGIFTDPWGGVHYNTSVGCCIEPPERTFDEALGFRCDEQERSAAAMRLKR